MLNIFDVFSLVIVTGNFCGSMNSTSDYYVFPRAIPFNFYVPIPFLIIFTCSLFT